MDQVVNFLNKNGWEKYKKVDYTWEKVKNKRPYVISFLTYDGKTVSFDPKQILFTLSSFYDMDTYDIYYMIINCKVINPIV